MKTNNKCAQQHNTQHDVEGEIIAEQQGRGNDKFNDKLSCVVAAITILISTFYHTSITVLQYGLGGHFKARLRRIYI